MKRILIAGAFALAAGGQAFAADLPPPMAPPPPRAPATYVPITAPAYSWSGLYLGINGGYGFGTVTPCATCGTASFTADGFLVGGTLGANYQFGAFVVGVEGDVGYDSLSVSPFSGTKFSSDWLATVRGRGGYAFDRILVYGTGGGAFAPAAVSAGPFAGSTTMTGWTAGGGIEAALSQNWTAKVEYLYLDFPTPSLDGHTFTFTESLVRAGINYKFNF